MHSIQQHISLKALNTFGVDVVAKKLLCIDHPKIVTDWISQRDRSCEPVLVLGGGSNILFVEDFGGIVLLNQIRGCRVVEEDSDSVLVTVGGGEEWDQFVEKCVTSGWYGVENLSAIPGTVGAAPIQNIGAYGVELESVFQRLHAIDLSSGTQIEMNRIDCQFGYRDSVFKKKRNNPLLITHVTFRLRKKYIPNLSYRDLQHKGLSTAQEVRDYVIKIRAKKLPDPKKMGNAGSFFKNPILLKKDYDQLLVRFPTIPHYPQSDGTQKVAAAWMIDQCGLKGYRQGDAGVHTHQALVLVNHGEASGEELMALARYVAHQVSQKFGVMLEVEPRVLGGSRM